jgi:hypothetical protein
MVPTWGTLFNANQGNSFMGATESWEIQPVDIREFQMETAKKKGPAVGPVPVDAELNS